MYFLLSYQMNQTTCWNNYPAKLTSMLLEPPYDQTIFYSFPILAQISSSIFLPVNLLYNHPHANYCCFASWRCPNPPSGPPLGSTSSLRLLAQSSILLGSDSVLLLHIQNLSVKLISRNSQQSWQESQFEFFWKAWCLYTFNAIQYLLSSLTLLELPPDLYKTS